MNDLIADPGSVEIDWSSLYSISTTNYAMPSAVRFTPPGENLFGGRTEYSLSFDSLTNAQFGGSRVTLGPAAVVRLLGSEIDVILNTNRTQTFEPDIFSNMGIDPKSKPLLVVKSTNHFYAGFAPIASEIIYVAAGATYPNNPRQTDYRRLTRRIWPRVEDPFA